MDASTGGHLASIRASTSPSSLSFSLLPPRTSPWCRIKRMEHATNDFTNTCGHLSPFADAWPGDHNGDHKHLPTSLLVISRERAHDDQVLHRASPSRFPDAGLPATSHYGFRTFIDSGTPHRRNQRSCIGAERTRDGSSLTRPPPKTVTNMCPVSFRCSCERPRSLYVSYPFL
jgi:hypothetical protein